MKQFHLRVLNNMRYFPLIYRLLFIVAIIGLASCGKRNDPAPDPVTITPPPTDSGNGNGGNTGGTGNTNKGYVFRNRFPVTSGVYLDNNDEVITQILFEFMDAKDDKYDYKNGTISITTKNFHITNTTYEFSDQYSYSILIDNMLPLNYKPSDVDSTKACFKIIDPAKKDKDGKQIIDLMYLWDFGVIGSNTIGVVGGKKLNGIPIPINVISEKVAKSKYKLL